MASCSILIDDGNLCAVKLRCGTRPSRSSTGPIAAGAKFYSYDWKSRAKEMLLENFEVNGCALDQSGGFTFINNSGVWSWNRKDKPELIVAVRWEREATVERLHRRSARAFAGRIVLLQSCGRISTGKAVLRATRR